MKFEDFIKKGDAKRTAKDIQLAKALMSTARQDLVFLRGLAIENISARKIVSNFYDVLRSLLEADAAVEGFKIYSHEAFTYYLLEKGQEKKSRNFERFRKVRNSINYYGKDIDVKEAAELVKEMKQLIEETIATLEDKIR